MAVDRIIPVTDAYGSMFGTSEEEVRRLIGSDSVMRSSFLEFCQRLTLNDQVMGGGGKLTKFEGIPTGLGDLGSAIATGAALLGGGPTFTPPNAPAGGGGNSPLSKGGVLKRKTSGGTVDSKLVDDLLGD